MAVIAVNIDQFYRVHYVGYYGQFECFNYESKFIFYIPKELFNMNWIKCLSLTGLLGNNKLFPKNIINMTKLKTLTANESNIIDIPSLTYLKNLKELYMYDLKDESNFNFNSAKGIAIKFFWGSKYNKNQLEKVLNRKLS